MRADLMLHLAGGIQGIVGGWEGGHDLITNGLDDGTFVGLGRGAHDIDADEYHVPGAQVAHDLVYMCAADHIGKQDC